MTMKRVASEGNQQGTKGIINVADSIKEQMGGFGMDFISDTVVHTPPTGYNYCAIQVVADAVIAAYAPACGGNALTGVTLAAGTVIPYTFTSIQLTSGKVLAFIGV